jgi:hypothetical protein
VICHQGAIDFNVANAIPAQAARCLCMMEGSIGITLTHCLMFAPLFPKSSPFFESSSKPSSTELPHLPFIVRKWTHFLKTIKKKDQELAVLDKERRRPDTPRPNLCRRSSCLETTSKPPSSIRNVITTPPGAKHEREEVLVLKPAVFEAENG